MLTVGFSFLDRGELEVDAYKDNGELDSATKTNKGSVTKQSDDRCQFSSA